ncbi:hypothetical protein D3C72_1271600 [compost metagenome]
MGIIKKADRLTGHRARRPTAAIAWDHQNIRFVYLNTLALVERNAHGGQPDALDKAQRIFRAAGKVDEQTHALAA